MIVVLTNAFLGLPPVVVGLGLYLLLSRSGLLGPAGLLFTPAAMVIAQTMLAAPIVVALVHRPSTLLWAEYGDLARIDGLSTMRSIALLFALGRASLLTAFLAAFGRAIAEVGAIIIVGGNIRDFTRTMTTAIALETSKGDSIAGARAWADPADAERCGVDYRVCASGTRWEKIAARRPFYTRRWPPAPSVRSTSR